MNKLLLLNWILENAGQYEHKYELETNSEDELHQQLHYDLYELNGRREVGLPKSLPKNPEEMVSVLRKHFKDKVTLISRVLNHYFPNQYLFYRVSKLEGEIFEGFDFFSEIVPEFEFPFSKIGRTGFKRYLTLNKALLGFSKRIWPELEAPQARVTWFLYRGLGELFLEKSDYNRYWIMATKEPYFEFLDSLEFDQDKTWSGRKEMQSGDLVFMYRMAPRKATTDIFRLKGDPYFNPWTAWDGFWVELDKVCQIEDISFSEMRNDPILGQWNVIRRQFQGVMTEPVPHSVYNQLLEHIPEAIRKRYGLEPEPLANVGQSGQFTSEAEFEEKVVEPLLKRWSFNYQAQYPCRFRFGSQNHRGRIDFYASDGQGPITLFEDKLRIINEQDWALAIDQAKSYALMLGLLSFVVASPEEIRVYSLDRNEETLEKRIPTNEISTYDAEIRRLLLRLR